MDSAVVKMDPVMETLVGDLLEDLEDSGVADDVVADVLGVALVRHVKRKLGTPGPGDLNHAWLDVEVDGIVVRVVIAPCPVE